MDAHHRGRCAEEDDLKSRGYNQAAAAAGGGGRGRMSCNFFKREKLDNLEEEDRRFLGMQFNIVNEAIRSLIRTGLKHYYLAC